MSKYFVLAADFNAFTTKVANADQAREERNEIFKQIRSSAQKAQDVETVLANIENSLAEINVDLRKRAMFTEVQILDRKVDKLPTFTNLHNVEKMFADYTACQPFNLFKEEAEQKLKTIDSTLLTVVTNERLEKELHLINQKIADTFSQTSKKKDCNRERDDFQYALDKVLNENFDQKK